MVFIWLHALCALCATIDSFRWWYAIRGGTLRFVLLGRSMCSSFAACRLKWWIVTIQWQFERNKCHWSLRNRPLSIRSWCILQLAAANHSILISAICSTYVPFYHFLRWQKRSRSPNSFILDISSHRNRYKSNNSLNIDASSLPYNMRKKDTRKTTLFEYSV